MKNERKDGTSPNVHRIIITQKQKSPKVRHIITQRQKS